VTAAAPAALAFGPHTAEEVVAALVDDVRGRPGEGERLLALLPERHPLYEGRGANAVMRLRGYLLAAFEQTGLPEGALPYVLEELESGREAYTVAAAARAVRGMPAPTPGVVPYLVRAVENIRFSDDTVTFAAYRPSWPTAGGTTALAEIFETLGWLGAHAAPALPALESMTGPRATEFTSESRARIARAIERIRGAGTPAPCCCAPAPRVGLTRRAPGPAARPGAIAGIRVEDQDGEALPFGTFFTGKPAVLAFFYTRCTNPDKCSATITRLARLQERRAEEGLAGRIRVAAITYDPEYDLPARLRAYGGSRGFRFGPDDRLLRSRDGFPILREHFQLGVGFTGTTVNRHRIELFILDARGEVAVTFERLQWQVEDVLDRARELLPARG
jgi:protein SCO1/2